MTVQRLLSPVLAAALASAPMLLFAADATPPAPLALKYDDIARETKVVALSGTCPVHVVPARDDRQNKETIGASFGGALVTGDAAPWITESLGHLKDFGFAVDTVNGSTAPQSGVTVKTTLTRAYTWQIGLKLFSMVALKAEFSDRNGVLQEKYYRAHGDKTNMWGADAEYITTLNYGINNLLPAMAQDLLSLCKGVKVEAYTYAGPDPAAKK
jgi:hypothetical protein